MDEFTIAVLGAMLSAQRSYCRWLTGHPCRWFVAQQEELLEEIEQAHWQMAAELE